MFACNSCCKVDENKEVVIGAPRSDAPGLDDLMVTDQRPQASPKEEEEAIKPVEEAVPEPEPAPAVAAPTEPKAVESAEEAPAEVPPSKDIPEVPVEPTRPTPRMRTFEVTLAGGGTADSQKGTELGLDVDYGNPNYLKVVVVKPGRVQTWNDCHPDLKVAKDDHFVGVNNALDSTEKMIEEIQNCVGPLVLKVWRGTEMEVTVEKESATQPIGVDIDGLTARLLKVKEGPISAYNEGLAPEQEKFVIRDGDQIVRANGERDIEKIIEVLRNAKLLNLIVYRPIA